MYILLIISVLSLFSYTNIKQVGEDEIYVKRLVYLKKDSSLFTGSLNSVGDVSSYKMNFCSGIPCGEWYEKDVYGGIIQQGNYLNKSILSDKSIQFMEKDTF